jgi:uncharacterized repeat protein (TIGR03803 family)
VLHLFNYNGRDGVSPSAGLVLDAAGNLYGTTFEGGLVNDGTVFKLSPNANGSWTEEILHSFSNNGVDGEHPNGGVLLDDTGDIYGTTYSGGTYPAGGTVFELAPRNGGGYAERILHNFNDGDNGDLPIGNLVLGPSGALYGVTIQGGHNNCGTVFELKPSGGTWNEKPLYKFKGHTDGCNPVGGVVFDASGNLYGNTQNGGSGTNFAGTVFVLSPSTSGDAWTETILHNFGNGLDGQNPYSGLIFGLNGNLYGTTYYGGQYSNGTVFEITP